MTDIVKNPNPTKDQHFMVDKEMIEYICRKANIQPGETVIEIGGGEGALTEVLAKTGNNITVVELDHYYAEYLKDKFKSFENVKVVEGNALDLSYIEYDRIVANLPYTITEPFLTVLAKTGALYFNNKDKKSSKVKSITLVVSQNSARKMVAPIQITEGKSRHFNTEFGLISAICQTQLEVDIDCAIPSTAFYPEPAVTSFLVNLTPKKKKTTVDRIMAEILITSKVIRDSNIYDLTNMQISQLIKDLIRNDSKMKSNTGPKNYHQTEDSYDYYLTTGRYDYEEYLEDEEEASAITKWQKKSEETYAYLYDDVRYNVLLTRGLEFLDKKELTYRLCG